MFKSLLWWWSRCMFVFQCFQNVVAVAVLWVCESPGLTFLHVNKYICTFSYFKSEFWEVHRAGSTSASQAVTNWCKFGAREMFLFQSENYTLHVFCVGLILAVVNERCVYVFMSFVNVPIFNSESVCSHRRNSFDLLFCIMFEVLKIEFWLWCMYTTLCVGNVSCRNWLWLLY